MELTYKSYLGGVGTINYVVFAINVQCQEKNWLGKWKYVFTTTSIEGSWTARMTVMTNAGYASYPTYTPTFRYNGSLNNFKTSISPFTGQGIGHQSIAIYNTQSNTTTVTGPCKLYNVNFKAVRDGGCCGIYARINKATW